MSGIRFARLHGFLLVDDTTHRGRHYASGFRFRGARMTDRATRRDFLVRERLFSGKDARDAVGKTSAGTSPSWAARSSCQRYRQEEALKYCDNLKLAGQSDWRLPNIRELPSISDDRKESTHQMQPKENTTLNHHRLTNLWTAEDVPEQCVPGEALGQMAA